MRLVSPGLHPGRATTTMAVSREIFAAWETGACGTTYRSAHPLAAMNVISSLARIHRGIRGSTTLMAFRVMTRLLLGVGFLPSGMTKVPIIGATVALLARRIPPPTAS